MSSTTQMPSYPTTMLVVLWVSTVFGGVHGGLIHTYIEEWFLRLFICLQHITRIKNGALNIILT